MMHLHIVIDRYRTGFDVYGEAEWEDAGTREVVATDVVGNVDALKALVAEVEAVLPRDEWTRDVVRTWYVTSDADVAEV